MKKELSVDDLIKSNGYCCQQWLCQKLIAEWFICFQEIAYDNLYHEWRLKPTKIID
jgi:hypothetical protein